MSDEMTYSAYSVLYDEISLLDDLLKAQEPIEPIRTDDEWQCGCCHEVVGWDELQVYGIQEIKNVYCSNCGHEVKWE